MPNILRRVEIKDTLFLSLKSFNYVDEKIQWVVNWPNREIIDKDIYLDDFKNWCDSNLIGLYIIDDNYFNLIDSLWVYIESERDLLLMVLRW